MKCPWCFRGSRPPSLLTPHTPIHLPAGRSPAHLAQGRGREGRLVTADNLVGRCMRAFIFLAVVLLREGGAWAWIQRGRG